MRENSWWCTRLQYNAERVSRTLPYFARSMDLEIVGPVEQPSAAEFFGGHVVRYAREHLEDSRVPKALYRVVFASRYSCEPGPGHVSQAAYTILHDHFADSEWAEKTPYRYD